MVEATQPQTFVQKVLARNTGVAAALVGEVFEAEPDLVFSHDNSAAIAAIFRSMGGERVFDPDRIAITLDHAAPAPTTQHAQNHAEIRAFVRDQGIRRFFDIGQGICHQVICERGLVHPGYVVLGADSHSTHTGALGAFSAGVGRSEMAALWATGRLWLRVPESMQIVLEGRLTPWVTAKDAALHIIGRLGADAATYMSVEFHGPGLASLSMSSRFVLTNMMAEMGAKNAWMAADETTWAWLAERGVEPANSYSLLPDTEASYAARHRFNLSDIEPQVACPHSVDNVVNLSQVRGTTVQQAFLGTCTNARLEDIAIAAHVVAGKQVHPGTRLLVIPASSQVLQEALAAGYIATLVEAGAAIGTPGCGPCMGNHYGIPAPGEVTISSANRNFRGRMGTPEAPIYLASPAVVAASAIAGCITHPAEIEPEEPTL